MTDPLAVLPLAVAAGGGQVDSFEVSQLVAAGIALLQRSATVVRALRGRRAAILLPTSPAFLTALAASDGRGSVLVNPLAAAPEIAYQLADADVGAVFTIEALAAALPPDLPRVLLDDAPRTARVVAAGATTEVPLTSPFALDLVGDTETPPLDEEAAVVYTSAMAGRPLGAILTHRNLLSNARATIEAVGLGPTDHSLAILPFSHLFGLVVSGVAPLLAGGRVTTMSRFHPVRAAELLLAGEITALVGVPAIFRALLSALERRSDGDRASLGALRVCVCGGAPLDESAQDRWFERTGVELRQGYGLTEGGPVCLFNRADRSNHRGTMGVPFPGIDVELRDRTGTPVSVGTEGELWVRGPNVSPGYVGIERPVATDWSDGLPRRDDWLDTGDRGVAQADGTIAFRGVSKPMFTRSGFNIYPREIERVVGRMAGVRTVTAYAEPEPSRENDIVLDIVGDVTTADVDAWCAANLSSYKRPTRLTVRQPTRAATPS